MSIAYVKVPSPPDAVTGVNAVATTFLINVLVAIACVTTSTLGSTANVNVLLVVCPAWSVILTVYSVDAEITVGVPDNIPVDVLNNSPAGKSMSIAYVNVWKPPFAVTGVNAVT